MRRAYNNAIILFEQYDWRGNKPFDETRNKSRFILVSFAYLQSSTVSNYNYLLFITN